jgi:Flp pilus assembly pilin Flp
LVTIGKEGIMYEKIMRGWMALSRADRGATTVEWLGLATIAILVIALLLPQVRATAGDIWSNVASEFGGFFG